LAAPYASHNLNNLRNLSNLRRSRLNIRLGFAVFSLPVSPAGRYTRARYGLKRHAFVAEDRHRIICSVEQDATFPRVVNQNAGNRQL
jgi:hypothetical protein